MMSQKKNSLGGHLSHPMDEKERIDSLKSYHILDTLPEKDYDDITSLASRAFKCPISCISFLDKERLWIKSKQGLSHVVFEKDYSFCQYTLLCDEIFVVNNTLKDERFFDNPYVVGNPNIQFYAAVPIISSSGSHLGALCVMDYKENHFSESQYMYLKFLANKVLRLLELRKKKIQLARCDKETNLQTKCYSNKNRKYAYQNKLSNYSTIKSDKCHELNKQISFNYVASSEVLSDVQMVENIKNVNSFCSITENKFLIAKKTNFSKYFNTNYRLEKAQSVPVSELISASLNLYKDKMNIYGIQLDITSDFSPNYKIQCKPSLTMQVISYFINNSIELIKHKKFKWIHLALKENYYDFEFSISDNRSRLSQNIAFCENENENENHDLEEKSLPFENKTYLNEIMCAIGGHYAIDASCENAKVIFFLPKRNYNLDN